MRIFAVAHHIIWSSALFRTNWYGCPNRQNIALVLVLDSEKESMDSERFMIHSWESNDSQKGDYHRLPKISPNSSTSANPNGTQMRFFFFFSHWLYANQPINHCSTHYQEIRRMSTRKNNRKTNTRSKKEETELSPPSTMLGIRIMIFMSAVDS